MKKKEIFVLTLFILLYSLLANSWYLIRERKYLLFPVILIALVVNIFARLPSHSVPGLRLKICDHGANCLIIFYFAMAFSAIFHSALVFRELPENWKSFTASAILCVALEFVIFWNGMISVYLTSVQLGLRIRVIGLICGFIPIANLIVLAVIIVKCKKEVAFESGKKRLNASRKEQKICETKYPVLLVHGVFFRDSRLLNYWGRIPGELQENGAAVYYGEHHSADSVSECAKELTIRIKRVLEDTGAEKVNVIAHSKGGLDMRCAIANGADKYVASLTTVNTPHRGCDFADYLLSKAPERFKNRVERIYNRAAKAAGDDHPDFMAAVSDLTAEKCASFNSSIPDPPEGIFCQSVGSLMKKATSGRFPLWMSYPLVKHFDGENDGLVAKDSFEWGKKYTLIRPKTNRGISHADMIDLCRENIPGFDVREFYVSLVADLKDRGL